jgi:hypothetical protein
MLIDPKMKINKKIIIGVVILNTIFLLLFLYFQPLCEPCIDKSDCPPCLSRQQYFIIYFGIAVNLFFLGYYFFKGTKR